MASCAYCNSTIFIGGKRDGNLRYCNAGCQQQGILAARADALPQADVDRFVADVHGGDCPKCQGPGPVDVHVSYRVWSALLMTNWSSRPAICCRSCGIKRKLGDAGFSLLLGWWGFPWGLLMTPIQVGRNLVGMAGGPNPAQPSPTLEKLLRLNLATRLPER